MTDIERGAVIREVMTDLDVGDEYFWMPERLVPFEHWVGHIPFAFWLVKSLRPRRVVELGTHRGNSYCAMCQSLAAFGIEARAHAVDTWQGDVHMTFESGILGELKAHHDPRYGAFSDLMQMPFDEARETFADGSIDLLHIDGTHTYDAVRHDFESWLPKMSDRGVVLFHDTMVRDGDFGVWRLWDEVSARYPGFGFQHSFGLGVLGVGPDLPRVVRMLFDRSPDPAAAAAIRTLFVTRGTALVDRLCRQMAEQATAAAGQEAERREAALNAQWAGRVATLTGQVQREIALRARLEAELALARATPPQAATIAPPEASTAPAAAPARGARTRGRTGFLDVFRKT